MLKPIRRLLPGATYECRYPSSTYRSVDKTKETFIISQKKYFKNVPSYQNIIDIFSGDWISIFPDDCGLITVPGRVRLFEDDRIKHAGKYLGGFENARILEIGPLEGGHSYLLEQMGAREIVAVEANARAFLKCLCTKEILGLKRVHYKLGDCIEYLAANPLEEFDVIIASGILYHLQDPVLLLDHVSRVTSKLYLWTHYFNREVMTDKVKSGKFESKMESVDYGGATYDLVKQYYEEVLLSKARFSGGTEIYSRWMTRESLLDCLKNVGFRNVHVLNDEVNHPHGPAISICAMK